MKRIHFPARCKQVSVLVCVLLLLPGCDGGIFGTGDGSDVMIDGNDSANPEPNSPVDGGDAQPPGIEPDETEDDSQAETRPFENLLIASNSQLPGISLFNLSDVALNARASADSATLFATAIQPGTNSEQASLALETTELSVIDATTSEPVLVLSPLNLGAFSVSTLIARNRLIADVSDNDPDDSLPAVEVIAIPSQQLPGTDEVARVRLLQMVSLDPDDRAASMSLVPADQLPGGSVIELGRFSASSFGLESDYRMAAPGSYRLMDSLGRVPPLAVELHAGQFHTLILVDEPAQLLSVQDSQPLERLD